MPAIPDATTQAIERLIPEGIRFALIAADPRGFVQVTTNLRDAPLSELLEAALGMAEGGELRTVRGPQDNSLSN